MKDKLNLFRNLMIFAALDGKMTEEEITFLSLRSTKWGISEKDFQAALAYARSPQAELVIPPKKDDRLELLRDILRVMAIDGEMGEAERKLFSLVAATMEISQQELHRVIDSVVKPK